MSPGPQGSQLSQKLLQECEVTCEPRGVSGCEQSGGEPGAQNLVSGTDANWNLINISLVLLSH